jgi:hypothetical protein
VDGDLGLCGQVAHCEVVLKNFMVDGIYLNFEAKNVNEVKLCQ